MTKTAALEMEAIRPMRHDLPHLIGPLPGPRARAGIARDHRSVSPSYTRGYPLLAHRGHDASGEDQRGTRVRLFPSPPPPPRGHPLVARRGEGAIVEDVDGNRFLDFNAGIAVVATGHCHPRVVEAIREQAGNLIHMSGTDFYYEALVDLAEKLGSLAPGGVERRVSFCNSGAEAVEGAMKLARYSPGRDKFIAFFGAFHGRTLGALSLTARKDVQRRGFGPLVPGVVHAPYPNCYRCPFGQTPANCAVECAKFIEDTLLKTIAPAEEVAAIVIEPVQGEGGYIVPPQKFFDELVRIAERHGILLVCDEVQSGMGRTGKMWASDHFQLTPDIMTVAKGIASGLPLGATVEIGRAH